MKSTGYRDAPYENQKMVNNEGKGRWVHLLTKGT